MKKSKIIVPALAVLLLSTAASVTGTVAWFTANRLFDTTVGEFAVVNTKDNLVCEMGEGLGTDVAANVVSVESGKVLTDASFEHVTANHYIFAPNAEGDAVGKKVALASADMTTGDNGLKREAAEEIYSAFTFTMDFKLALSSAASKDVGLFFKANEAIMSKKVTLPVGFAMGTGIFYSDEKCTQAIEAGFVTGSAKTAFTRSTALSYAFTVPANTAIAANTYYTTAACTDYVAARDASGDALPVYVKNPYRLDTGLGFRLAFVGTNTNAATRVWSDFRPISGDHHAKHVAGEAAVAAEFATASTTLDYVAPALIDGDNVTDPESLDGARTVFTGSPLYLGHFDKAQAGNIVTLSYTVVAWFEGTDDNVVNNLDTIYDTMVSYLSFEAINIPN